jgi:hypothetical protein
MVSDVKLAANRRNAQKSTGPRTIAGKNRSRCNALDHGCRADILIMQTEDQQALPVMWSCGSTARDRLFPVSSTLRREVFKEWDPEV